MSDEVVIQQKRTSLTLGGNRQQVFVLPKHIVAEINKHRPQIVTRGSNPTVRVQQRSSKLEIGGTGTQGPPGETEGATFLATAGATIHGGRAVKIENDLIFHPDTSSPTDAPETIGIAVQSGNTGAQLLVRTGGQLSETSWNWAPGYVYCDNAGVLVQPAPSSGWLLAIARVVNPTTIEVDIDTPIIRSA